jgi:flagellum-specific peptidoglycan hydrolase FlgJ
MPRPEADPALKPFLQDIGVLDANTKGSNHVYTATIATLRKRAYEARGKWEQDNSAVTAIVGAMLAPPAPLPSTSSVPIDSASLSGLLNTSIEDFNKNIAGRFEPYVKFFAPGCRYIQQKYGVPGVFVIIAGELENSLGNPAVMLGRNMFNIEATGWHGKTVTYYQKDGAGVKHARKFRDYDSYFQAVDDFGKLLASNAGNGRDTYAAALARYKRDKDLSKYLLAARLIYAPPTETLGGGNSANPLPDMLKVVARVRAIDPSIVP